MPELLNKNIVMEKKMKKKVPYHIMMLFLAVSLGSCKTFYHFSEHSPTVSADGRTVVYQSDKFTPGIYKIYITHKKGNSWSWPFFMKNINSVENDGAPFLTYDQNSLLLSSDRKGGKGDVDIWISYRHGKKWKEPVNVGAPVNTKEYEGFATLSPDGRSLYFVRKCPDKQKCSEDENFGIFYSEFSGKKWSEPERMPYPINTEYSEFAPVILADGKTLIFSSTRPGGIGGYDLYRSVQEENGTWSRPENLGNFINTRTNDRVVSVPASGDLMYYSRPDWRDADVFRIYSAVIPEKFRQTRVMALYGRVKDCADMKKTVHADIVITDEEKGSRDKTVTTNEKDGKFFVILNKGRIYDISVRKKGYTFYSTRIDLRKLEKYRELNWDICLEVLKPGAKVILNNISFSYKSSDLLNNSKNELLRAISLMKENPSLTVEVAGHTDNRGTPVSNLQLSNRRAEKVMSYLIRNGISPQRLVATGFGSSRPVADNQTEEGRILNRRVELKVVYIR